MFVKNYYILCKCPGSNTTSGLYAGSGLGINPNLSNCNTNQVLNLKCCNGTTLSCNGFVYGTNSSAYFADQVYILESNTCYTCGSGSSVHEINSTYTSKGEYQDGIVHGNSWSANNSDPCDEEHICRYIDYGSSYNARMYKRLRVRCGAGSGTSADNNPVQLDEYALEGMYSMSNIGTRVFRTKNGYEISFRNNSQESKTIRQLGFFLDIGYYCPTNDDSAITLWDNTKSIMLANISPGFIYEPVGSANNNTGINSNIPILVEKIKFNIPIIVPAGETKTVNIWYDIEQLMDQSQVG